MSISRQDRDDYERAKKDAAYYTHKAKTFERQLFGPEDRDHCPILTDEAAHGVLAERGKAFNKEITNLLHPNSLAQGIKHDQDKIRWDLIPFDALKEITKVLTEGGKKYQDRNWEKGINYSRLSRAALGHIIDWYQTGEENDEEWNLNHLAHAGCCILFLLAYRLRNMDQFDDRPRSNLSKLGKYNTTPSTPATERRAERETGSEILQTTRDIFESKPESDYQKKFQP